MSDQNFNQSIKHFCGDSQATGLFIEANYHGNNYTQPINSEKSPELLEGTLVPNIMLVKNYNSHAKINGMKDNDIHNQYIDFIVRTALFHKELDSPTFVEKYLEIARKNLRAGIDHYVDMQLKDITFPTGGNSLHNLLTRATSVIDDAGSFRFKYSVSLSDLDITNTTKFYDYMNTHILSMILVNCNNSTGVGTTSKNISAFFINPNSGARSSKDIGNFSILKTQCEATRGVIWRSQTISTANNLCLLPRFTDSENPTSIVDIFNHFKTSNTQLQNYRNAIYDIIIDVMYDHIAALYTELGGIEKLVNTYEGKSTVDEKKDLLKNWSLELNSNGNLLRDFKENLFVKIFNYVEKQINLVSLPKFVTLDKNTHANKLFENVFLKWHTLDREAREFYRAHLHIFRKVGISHSNTKKEEAGWEDIGDQVENLDFLKSLDRKEIRINLMKEFPGSINILFAKTLPYIPISSSQFINKIWYTPKNSAVPVSVNVTKETFLQDLYMCVYNGQNCNIASSALNLPDTYSQVESNRNDFEISDIFVIKHFIESRKPKTTPNENKVNKSFDALFVEDIVSRVSYKLDGNGNLYKIEGDTVTPYSIDDNITIDNCVGTRLAGNPLNCSRLVRDCLLSEDKNKLNECIDTMLEANMFDVAQSECQNVDPNVAIQILKTFDIGQVPTTDPVLGKILVPQSFSHWKETKLSSLKPKLQNAILKNNKLCDYLKGVIAFVTMNPAILNRHIGPDVKSSIVNQKIDDPYITALNKTPYIIPYHTPQEQKLFTAQSLVNTIQYPQIPITSNAHINNPFNNILYGSNGIGVQASQSYRPMTGGASVHEESLMRKIKRNGSTSQLIKSLMDNLFEEMRLGGIPLNDIDRERIQDGIAKLARGEEKLGKYYGMLRTLTDLALFFKASGCIPNHNTEKRELCLETIKSRSDTIEYLYQNIGTVKKCIGEGIDSLDAQCKEIVGIYSSLVTKL